MHFKRQAKQEGKHINMTKEPIDNRLAMSGNVQGFELPRGCLMTTGLILLPIVTLAVGLARAGNFQNVTLSVAVAAIIALLFVRKV